MIPRFALATGRVWHRRHQPEHRFQYPLWLVWCDVDAPDEMLARQRWWGRRWRPITFRERDFVDHKDRPLGDKVRAKAGELGLDWSSGSVYMLGQWRTFGLLFNPLVLYLHYPPDAQRPDAMLAEVRNTPWRERHFYPVPLNRDGTPQVREHDKNFHVSPFLPLALRYRWTLHAVFPELRLTLEDLDESRVVFAAGLTMTLREADPDDMKAVVRRFGMQSAKTVVWIYAQAWRLWRKGATFYGHPGRGSSGHGDQQRRHSKGDE